MYGWYAISIERVKEDVTVRHVPDHKRNFATAIFKVHIHVSDMESWRKWSGVPRLTFSYLQWCFHNVGHVSKEGLDPSLYDLSLEQS